MQAPISNRLTLPRFEGGEQNQQPAHMLLRKREEMGKENKGAPVT